MARWESAPAFMSARAYSSPPVTLSRAGPSQRSASTMARPRSACLKTRSTGAKSRMAALRSPAARFTTPTPGIDLACFVAEPHPKRSIPLGGHLDSWMSQYELVLYRTLVLGYPPVQVTNKALLVASLGEVNALAELRAAPHPHWSSTASFRRSKSSTSAATRTDRPGGPVLPRRGPTAWSAAAAARAVLAVCSCVQDQAVPRR